MSRIISFSTADKAHIIEFLGAAGQFTDEQQRIVPFISERARTAQAELDEQDLGWGLSVPEALDHLLAGHASSTACAAGNAYAAAMQVLIDSNSSDSLDLAVYAKPATFFDALDDELRRVGVSADLLPGQYVMGGLPLDFPFSLPLPEDAMESFGSWPLEKTGPVADVYRGVLESVEESFTYDLKLLVDRLDLEHGNWQECRQDRDWYTQDTIFFSITG